MSRTANQIPLSIRKNGGIINDTLDAGGAVDFYKGMLVRKNASGQAISIPAAPASDGAVTSAAGAEKGIYGIALSDYLPATGGGVAGTALATQKIEADTLLWMLANGTTNQASIGDRHPLAWTAASKTLVVNLGTSSVPVVEIVDVEPNLYPFDEKSTETYNMVLVKILPALLEIAPEA